MRDEKNVESVERIAAWGDGLEACLFKGIVVERGFVSVNRDSVHKPNEMVRLNHQVGTIRREF